MQPGYGPTHFLSSETPQSGEHAALDQPRRAMLDALHIGQAFLAGFDWGGRAACVVSALWPTACVASPLCTGYQIQDVASLRLAIGKLCLMQLHCRYPATLSPGNSQIEVGMIVARTRS